MDKIIRKGGDKEALRAIELLWTSLGRLPQKGAPAPEINAFNRHPMYNLNFDRADAKAAMSLLRQERERLQKERDSKVISLDPSQIERSGGERNGP